MAADPTPTPPGAPAQQLPARPMGFTPTPAVVQFSRLKPSEAGANPIVAVILDTPDARVVTYWTEPELLHMLDTGRALIAEPALTIADTIDLERLKDTKPFEPGGNA